MRDHHILLKPFLIVIFGLLTSHFALGDFSQGLSDMTYQGSRSCYVNIIKKQGKISEIHLIGPYRVRARTLPFTLDGPRNGTAKRYYGPLPSGHSAPNEVIRILPSGETILDRHHGKSAFRVRVSDKENYFTYNSREYQIGGNRKRYFIKSIRIKINRKRGTFFFESYTKSNHRTNYTRTFRCRNLN